MKLKPKKVFIREGIDQAIVGQTWGIQVETDNGKVIALAGCGITGAKPLIDRICETDGMCCPHDGGYCHHACDGWGECFRERGGGELTTPHKGFPIVRPLLHSCADLAEGAKP